MSSTVPGSTRGSPLEEEWNWSRQVIESVSNGIMIADADDPDLPLIYVNPAFERMTGYSQSEVVGKNCRFLQRSDTHQPGLEILREALHQGTAIRTVLKNYRKDGTLFWNELYLSPIRDRDGRLTQYAGIQNDVTARVELEARLAFMAQHDMLTGLANRFKLMDRIEQALARAARTKRMVAILLFDLTSFKAVNDMFGHEAGDNLLKTVAEHLQAGTRQYEIAARLGGDEFVVVLENLQYEHEATFAMERLTSQIEQPLTVAGQKFQPSVSVGLAISPRDGTTPRQMLHSADTAMYVAKQLHKESQAGYPAAKLNLIVAQGNTPIAR